MISFDISPHLLGCQVHDELGVRLGATFKGANTGERRWPSLFSCAAVAHRVQRVATEFLPCTRNSCDQLFDRRTSLSSAPVRWRQRLRGMLGYSHREAA